MAQQKPWYAGEHQDALFYLLIAIFFIELIVGGVAFFYGIIHAAPEVPGGPPLARFPWLAWGLAAVLSPVALLLIVHLAGSWLQGAITRDEEVKAEAQKGDAENLPDGVKRFYAFVRHAPTIVLLIAVLFCGVALFFVEGALGALMELGRALVPHIPWIAGSAAALLSICFLAHVCMVYRQRKMENEYAWRREVLEKTGLVLVDKGSVPLPQNGVQQALIAPETLVLDVSHSAELPPSQEDAGNANGKDNTD